MRTDLYKRHRFPTEIISHCVWLYHRFDMSFRAVEELLFERGVVLSYETVRRWCLRFGREYARRLNRRRAQLGDKWHLDEVFLNISKSVAPRLGVVQDSTSNAKTAKVPVSTAFLEVAVGDARLGKRHA